MAEGFPPLFFFFSGPFLNPEVTVPRAGVLGTGMRLDWPCAVGGRGMKRPQEETGCRPARSGNNYLHILL